MGCKEWGWGDRTGCGDGVRGAGMGCRDGIMGCRLRGRDGAEFGAQGGDLGSGRECRDRGAGFGVQGSGCRVWGAGHKRRGGENGVQTTRWSVGLGKEGQGLGAREGIRGTGEGAGDWMGTR